MIQPARRSPTGRWLLIPALTLLAACSTSGSANAPTTISLSMSPTTSGTSIGPTTTRGVVPAAPTSAAATADDGTTGVTTAPGVTAPAATSVSPPPPTTGSVTTAPVATAPLDTPPTSASLVPAPAVIVDPPPSTAVADAPSTTAPGPAVRSGANVNADVDAAVGDPISISIPSIGVESLLVPTGALADGTMAVPTDASIAGWFTGGPKPGQRGPAVIMGHLDQKRTGPGVFWHLRDLQVGAEVTIHTTTGDVVFVARESDLIAKDEFPTERVYGSVPAPALRLITCGGSFDRKIGHYRSNVVVYLVPEVAP